MQIYALEFLNHSVIYFEELADAVEVQANSSASLCPRLVVVPVIPSSLLTQAAPDAGRAEVTSRQVTPPAQVS